MSLEHVLEAFLEPVTWTPHTAARHLATPIAVIAAQDCETQLYTRRPLSKLVRRTARTIGEHPTQVWTRYPSLGEIAFIITGTKDTGARATDQYHRIDIRIVKFGFDPFDSEYQIDPYESSDAFAHALGTPDFLHAVKHHGIEWVAP